MISPLVRYLKTVDNTKTAFDCLYIIFQLTMISGTSYLIDLLLTHDIMNVLFGYIHGSNIKLKKFCVKILGNMLSGNDVITQRIINKGALDLFKHLLETDDEDLLYEVVWGASNIAAGTCSQIEKIHQNGIVYKVIDILQNYIELMPDAHRDIKYRIAKECYYFLANIITGCLEIVLSDLLCSPRFDVINLLFEGLNKFPRESDLLAQILKAIRRYLSSEEDMSDFTLNIKSRLINMGLEDVLSYLCTHENNYVKEMAHFILKNFIYDQDIN